MKTFDEVFNEIKESVTVSKNGKIKKTFSRSDFDKLLRAFLNETGYKTKVASTKGGELVLTEIEPIKAFRDTVITKLLVDAGLDKAEASKIASEYQFTKVDGLYEIISEIIYQYMAAGKKFDFMPKEDFNGSLTIKDVGESVAEYSSIRKAGDNSPAEKFKVKTKKHRVLEKKSKAPKWLKEKFNK